jgi:hypothetical protein
MSEDVERLHERIEAREHEVAALKQRTVGRGRRTRSPHILCGLPLYDVAMGPDPDKNEVRGHARGIIAIGDIATGVLAIGGFARGIVAVGGGAVGFIALGGGALGVIAFGGGAIGILLAIGGMAIGTFAGGGCAVGFAAVGSCAFGYYACGEVAIGKHVLSAMQRDPQAVRFFGPWIPKLFGF